MSSCCRFGVVDSDLNAGTAVVVEADMTPAPPAVLALAARMPLLAASMAAALVLEARTLDPACQAQAVSARSMHQLLSFYVTSDVQKGKEATKISSKDGDELGATTIGQYERLMKIDHSD